MCLHGEVTNVRRLERHLPLQVELRDGRKLTADDVVLALGNPKPASLAITAPVADHPAYVADPWSGELQFSRNQKSCSIGSGLTAADVINAASSDPQRTPTLHALSRHGLVPPRQTAFRPDAFKGDGNALLLAASTSLRGLTKAVRLLAREAESCGGDWREAITFVRNMAPTIWQRLSEHDRVRFLRHLRAQWDVHRHRLPLQLIQRIDELRKTQRLHVHAGQLLRFADRARTHRSDLAHARHAVAAHGSLRSRRELHRAGLCDRAFHRAAVAQPRAMRSMRSRLARTRVAHGPAWRRYRRRMAGPAHICSTWGPCCVQTCGRRQRPASCAGMPSGWRRCWRPSGIDVDNVIFTRAPSGNETGQNRCPYSNRRSD